MSKHGKHTVIGTLKQSIITCAESDLFPLEVLLYSGAIKHMEKKHKESIKYIDKISLILDEPDFVGKHPEEDNSIELIKKFDDNMLLAIKLSVDGYLYVANMYSVTDAKIKNRLNSGRLKIFENC